MEQLRHPLSSAIANLSELLEQLDNSPGKLNKRYRRVLELELDSLQSLQRELNHGPPTRRYWSLGQSSIPILNSMINAVRRSPAAVPDQLLKQTQESVSELAVALGHVAEGRD